MTRCTRCTPGNGARRRLVCLSSRRPMRPGRRRYRLIRPRLRPWCRTEESLCGCSLFAATLAKWNFPCLPRSHCKAGESPERKGGLMAPKDSPVDVTDVTQPKAQVAVVLVTRVTHHFWFLGWLGPVTRITPIGVAQVCFAL